MDAFDDWIARRMAREGTPGLSIVATDREKTLWAKGYGFADIAAQQRVTPETLFEFGSIGKSFTALLLLRMQERGLVDLTAPVADYLPWFAVKSTYEPITIEHLLSHTSGIISGTDFAAEGRYEAWALRDLEVSGPPGVNYAYSNIAYKILGYLIEDLLGVSYGEAVTTEILTPLGMRESVVPITNADRQRIAVAYRWQYNDRPGHTRYPLVTETWIETGTGDGGIAASANDMGIYARLLLNRGAGIVSDASFEAMIAPIARVDEPGWWDSYGYGLANWRKDGRAYYGHTGGMIGYTAQLFIEPDTGIAVVAMVNGPGMVMPFAQEAIDATRAMIEQREYCPSEITSRQSIENAAELEGIYWEDGTSLLLKAVGDGMTVEYDGKSGQAENRPGEMFFVDLPGFERFLLGVEREGGAIVALTHGPRCFVREGADLPVPQNVPAEWSAYTGQYRCYNPWTTPIQIVLRRGKLLAIESDGYETELFPLTGEHFQFGEAPTAERMSFDTIVDGKALRLIQSGQAMYRV